MNKSQKNPLLELVIFEELFGSIKSTIPEHIVPHFDTLIGYGGRWQNIREPCTSKSNFGGTFSTVRFSIVKSVIRTEPFYQHLK